MLSIYRVAILLLIAFALTSGCSKLRNPIVATVNNEPITAAELRAKMGMERSKFDPTLLAQEGNFLEFRKQALEKLIQEKILLTEARRLGIAPTQEELKNIDQQYSQALSFDEGDFPLTSQGIDSKAWKRAQHNRLVINKLILQEVVDKIPIAEDKIQAYYKQHLQEFHQTAQLHARQILVDSQELADQILSKIKRGEDFGELAKQHSLSPDSRRGGDLGFFEAKIYPPIFSEVCRELVTGEVSDVIQTEYGYQIFQLLDRRPERQIPYEEASEQIRKLLKENESEQLFGNWLTTLQSKATIAINEDAMKGVLLEKAN